MRPPVAVLFFCMSMMARQRVSHQCLGRKSRELKESLSCGPEGSAPGAHGGRHAAPRVRPARPLRVRDARAPVRGNAVGARASRPAGPRPGAARKTEKLESCEPAGWGRGAGFQIPRSPPRRGEWPCPCRFCQIFPVTRSQNSERSLVRGNGSLGTGVPRKPQSGSHPSFT